jgi:hypothetical protein
MPGPGRGWIWHGDAMAIILSALFWYFLVFNAFYRDINGGKVNIIANNSQKCTMTARPACTRIRLSTLLPALQGHTSCKAIQKSSRC